MTIEDHLQKSNFTRLQDNVYIETFRIWVSALHIITQFLNPITEIVFSVLTYFFIQCNICKPKYLWIFRWSIITRPVSPFIIATAMTLPRCRQSKWDACI